MIYPNCDLHIHSISSGHAFNTIDEIINFSEKHEYSMIGISDHGPDMERAPHIGYFEMLYRLPHRVGNMNVLYGCESNIIDINGNIDIPDRLISEMDYIIAGLHNRTCYTGNSIDDNTKAIVSVIRSRKADIISHPISLGFLADPEIIVQAALEEQIILECNKSVLKEAVIHQKKEVIHLTTELLNNALEAEVPVLLGSDAHHISEMAISDEELSIIKDIYGISLSRLLNENVTKLEHILLRRKKQRSIMYHEE